MSRRCALVAATPFQVLNALALAYEIKGDHDGNGSSSACDFYIVGGFSHDMRTATRLISHRTIADHVHLVSPKHDAYGRGAMNATDDELFDWLDFLSSDDTIEPFQAEGCYDEMFFSLPTLTAETLAAMNPSAKLVLFDDGYGSYFSNILSDSGWSGRDPDEFRLLRPEMCRGDMGLVASHLPIPFEDPLFAALANDVLSYVPAPDDDGKGSPRYPRVAYLSQPFEESELVPDAYERVSHLMKQFAGASIVKPHPRDDFQEIYDRFGDSAPIDARGHSMEMMCLNGEIADGNVLVASFSTAQYVPALMFGLRPYALFLYELMLEDEAQRAELSSMVEHLAELYGECSKERICVAGSWEEAGRFLDGIGS